MACWGVFNLMGFVVSRIVFIVMERDSREILYVICFYVSL